MNKSINQLENVRQDMIRNLNLEETKAYIKYLNLRRFNSNHAEYRDFYSEKLKEVFELTEDKFINLELFSLNNELDLSNCKVLLLALKSEIAKVSYTSLLLNNGYITLKTNLEALKSLMLEDDAEFNINLAIVNLMQTMEFLIHSLAYHENLYDNTSIDEQLRETEIEKDYVMGKANEIEGVKLLIENDYLDLLETYENVLKSLNEILGDYKIVSSEVLSVINEYLIDRES